MGLLTQQVDNILGGVSQAPPQQRAEGQGQAMINGFDSVSHGKIKRPPSKHVALFNGPMSTGIDDAFLYDINRDSTEQYMVIIADGLIYVIDKVTGSLLPVMTPDGQDYLVQPETVPNPNFFYDDFLYPALGLTLDGQTNLQGFVWKLLHGTSPDLVDLAGTMEVQGFLDGGKLVIDTPAPVADYTVAVDVIGWKAPDSDLTTLWARCPNDTAADQNGYRLSINYNKLSLDCFKSGTQQFAQQVYTPGTVYSTPKTFYLQIVGNVITVSVGPAGNTNPAAINVVLTYTDTSNAGGAAFTAPGYTGLGGNTSGNGNPSNRMQHWKATYFHAGDIPAPVPIGTLGFRAVTIADTTFIVNQSVTVARKLLKSAKQPTASLIALRQADFGTSYTITINGIALGFTTGTAASPDARPQLSTDSLAGKVIQLIQANATLNAQFTATQFGSTVYLVRNDGADYTLTVSDGLADQAIVAVKGTCQNFDLLPARAPNGYLVEITGDPSNVFDNYWVQYNDEGQPQQDGVWLETVGPGELVAFDPSTMPHQLVRMGSLLVGFPNAGTPPKPAITAGNPTFVNYGDDGQGDYGRPNIGDNTHFQTITPVLDATAHVLTFCYDVSAPLLPPGETIQVVINQVVSGVTTSLGFKTYGGGISQANETQQYTTSLANGAAFTIELIYSRAATPPTNHQAFITPHAKLDPSGIPGLSVSVNKAAIFTFNPIQVYPNGTTITVQSVAYTLTSDMTGVQLATALQALTYSGATATNPNAGVLWLTFSASGPAPAGTAVITWPASTTFSNPGIAITPSGLIGEIIVNDTDGSRGQITANTSTTITVASLSGGVDNVFNTGDSCHVIGTASKYFVFQQCPWTPREVGDLNTNPFPSFTGQTIFEVFFTRDRLGFLSRNNVVLSGSDDLYNFFRTTVTDLLDSDLIDVQAASQQVSDFSSAVHWQEGLYLFADTVQTELVGDPLLSPKTVSLVPKTYYPNAKIRPVAMDRRIFFARERSGSTQIFRLQRARYPQVGLDAEDTTVAVPLYLPGAPLQLVGDPALEILAVTVDGAPNSVFIYQYHYENTELTQDSWHRWDFASDTIVKNIDMLDGVLTLLLERSFGILYLETIDLQIGLTDTL